ncbi:MAG TPA: TetR/AcrR family transcriptional regulator [Prolixibacteraceae bacterium]|nr:TetR/AcrR family transcriptional regulator [Prolixibacteraceae bacterium]
MSPRTAFQFQEIRQEKRKLILDTALELFAEKGYHATAISQIAQKAGISKGLLYNYFESKEALLTQLFRQLAQEVTDMLDPDHDGEISVGEAETFFDTLFESLQQKRRFWKLYFQLSLQPAVFELVSRPQTLGTIRKNQEILTRFFSRCGPKDPATNLLLASSVMKGFAMQYVFAPELFPPDAVENFKKQLKELLLNTAIQ